MRPPLDPLVTNTQTANDIFKDDYMQQTHILSLQTEIIAVSSFKLLCLNGFYLVTKMSSSKLRDIFPWSCQLWVQPFVFEHLFDLC